MIVSIRFLILDPLTPDTHTSGARSSRFEFGEVEGIDGRPTRPCVGKRLADQLHSGRDLRDPYLLQSRYQVKMAAKLIMSVNGIRNLTGGGEPQPITDGRLVPTARSRNKPGKEGEYACLPKMVSKCGAHFCGL